MPTLNIQDYGARGDGVCPDTRAIQAAIDACHRSGGGTVLFPAGGSYLTGTFYVRGRIEVHVERGARIIGSEHRQDYTNDPLCCLIEASDADHIALSGGGIIDGNGAHFMEQEIPYIDRAKPWRPNLIKLIRCRHVTLRDLHIRDSARWCVHLAGCEDVVVHGLRILNNMKGPNCDGITVDHCRNVRVSDCHIEAGDDCICLKNTSEFADCGPTENVTVSNCTIKTTSAALKIGTESVDAFRNIVFSNCTIHQSNRGLTIQLRDEGDVEDVLFGNITVETRLFHPAWWGAAEPIHISVTPRRPGTRVGRVRRVRFSDIVCRGESGVFIASSAPGRCQDIRLHNVSVELTKWSRWEGGRHDWRPRSDHSAASDEQVLGDASGDIQHWTAGFYLQDADDVRLRDCQVKWGRSPPDYYRHALEAHRTRGLVLHDFQGESAHPDRYPATLIED